jgi:hypothetical protein
MEISHSIPLLQSSEFTVGKVTIAKVVGGPEGFGDLRFKELHPYIQALKVVTRRIQHSLG